MKNILKPLKIAGFLVGMYSAVNIAASDFKENTWPEEVNKLDVSLPSGSHQDRIKPGMKETAQPAPQKIYPFPSQKNIFGIEANDRRFEEIDDSSLHMPETRKSGQVPTLNNMGSMHPEQDFCSRAFTDYAATAISLKPFLDIGAAYGINTLAALGKKRVKVIANDVDARHLLILRKSTLPDLRENLYLNNHIFPAELDFPPHSLSAVLLSRVAHFLTGSQIETGLQKIYNWLEPSGRFYMVVGSPYLPHLAPFLPIYEKRVQEGIKWPGEIYNASKLIPTLKPDFPALFHVFDPKVLEKLIQGAGFRVEKADLFDITYWDPDYVTNGKGYCGLIAIKD